ncbi:hypothetical protein [Polaromonas eurypsychrophila]|uniref:hypothetical protein n=1 Tax=Polaromonas eurypsychrophila TaxID=1614635 RepID=UPI00166ABB40|nr:hypothetical protein [Polaromonas eurypsychrophila]
MMLLDHLLEAVNARKNRALLVAEASLSESQFRAFRRLFLDEFGRNGLETELARIVAEDQKRKGAELGRPIHAGKEVPHD